ncbi:hypothetical protein CP532_5000 [Ophiocordyceps camponoti-leonardi (nom. inval.)]|nr:hypothetical protein CP532_5000 [Ophiocordyceps camponoti-leonardi (nom. inval.)]
MDDDIAVVGIGLRFPGDASSPEQLWKVLERGESQWSEFPRDRLNIDGYYHPSGDRQGSISFRGAHFLKGDIAAFDSPVSSLVTHYTLTFHLHAKFFSIAAEDAKAIDPQQRMLLEVSYEALENAGFRKEDLDGSDTAVYVGSFVKDYEQICLRDPDWQPRYAATGNGIAIMANRISHFFNFHGPSMTIDTGCSGSLVSVHLAVQSLQSHESSLALAAGSGLILTPNTIMPMTALNFLSPDGKCFTFDERANGYGRGEGIGVVVMKRLSDAIRDNDTIRAVIRSSSVNQDGRTPGKSAVEFDGRLQVLTDWFRRLGITLPSKEAQVANIRAAYASAGLSFEQTAYVECHGTGTQAGDWRELRAVSETLGPVRSKDNPVVVGSIKPNIGHLEGAAGVAGIIKSVLMLERAKIPPNINFEKGNTSIDFEEWRVTVPRTVMEWPKEGIRRVSVNCFGFGGTNAHVILDEAPGYLAARGMFGQHSSVEHMRAVSAWEVEAHQSELLFCYSSHEKSGVERIVESHLDFLGSKERAGPGLCLRDYAYTLGCRRSALEWRGFVVADKRGDLVSKAKLMIQEGVVRACRDQMPRIGFIFCGQGSQWAQMGKDLLVFDAFRCGICDASRYMALALGACFNLTEELLRTEDESRINQVMLAQPATTAVQVALVDLLASIGIHPRHVVGHSSGEIAAAYAAGALTREQAWEVAYYRGMAAASLGDRAPKLRGAMMAVGLSEREAEAYLVGQSAQVACINSPKSVTISGQASTISSLERTLRARGVFCRVLNVGVAYHSSHMRLVEHDYRDDLVGLEASSCEPSIRMVSSVTGAVVDGSELEASYWAANMVSPVRYATALETMMKHEDRPDMIIEVSPRPSLRSPTLDVLSATLAGNHQTEYRAVMEKDGTAGPLLKLVGELWTRGCVLDMEPLTPGAKCLSDLPPYRWNHGRTYWHESHLSIANRFRAYGRRDLIGAPTADSMPMEPRWRGFIRVSENPWIQDHQVQKTMVYPASGMVSMVLEAASQTRPDVFGYELVNMRIEKAMVIPNSTHGLEVALNMKTDDEPASFSIYSKPLGREWERNASGGLYFRTRPDVWASVFNGHDDRLEALDKTCDEWLDPRQLYEALDTVGINYGPLFRNVVEVRRREAAVVGRVRVPDTRSKMPAKFEYPHVLHPATLDGMFQTLFAVDSSPMVPTFIRSVFVSVGSPPSSSSCFTGYATVERAGVRGAEASIAMRGSDDTRVIIDGLHLTGLSSPAEGGFLPNHRGLCSEIVWDEDAASASPTQYANLVTLLAHKFPALAVLQCGGGFAAARETLTAVGGGGRDETPRLTRYTLLEGRGEEVDKILDWAADTPLRPLIEVKQRVDEEEISDHLYHVIVVFADAEVDVDVNRLRKQLRAGGVLLTQHHQDGQTNGVGNVEQVAFDAVVLNVYRQPTATAELKDVVLLLPDEPSAEALAFTETFQQLMSTAVVKVVSAAEVKKEQASELLAGKLVISLLDFSLREDAEPCSVFEWNENDFDVFNAVQTSARGILWITRSAHMNPRNPKGAPIVPLARTLMSEDPLKTIVSLDVGFETLLGSSSLSRNVLEIIDRTWKTKAVSTEPDEAPREMEYGEEDGRLYIPRLRPCAALNRLLLEDDDGSNTNSRDLVRRPFAYDECPRELRLVLARPGIGDEAQCWTESDCDDDPGELRPDEVDVEITEVPLTHLDLETAMGRSCESVLGMDAVGRVRRFGCCVRGLKVGDEVASLTADGAMRNLVRVEARMVMKAKKKQKQEISLPSLLVSAYYGLVYMGRCGPGRSVLIQAGASAHGLAAVNIARRTGAEIFVSVFGPDAGRQRELVRRSGVEDGSIVDVVDESCLVAFVRARTGGRGVDVVFNPTGEYIGAGFQSVRRGGTVVQFADRSRAVSSMGGPATVVNLHLGQLVRDDAALVAEMLERVVRLVEGEEDGDDDGDEDDGEEEEADTWDIDRIPDALRRLQTAPYSGPVRLVVNGRESQVKAAQPHKTTNSITAEAIDPNGTYLLVGGLGGLGRSIAELLVSSGARHLALLSRSAASSSSPSSSSSSASWLAGLRSRGVNVQTFGAEICDADQLSSALSTMATQMPPIRGVFHCAAVVRDAVFHNMVFSDWREATMAKTKGTLNLVRAVPEDAFFVFLASAAGVIGSRGQANYAAGNGFQDVMARSLRLGCDCDDGGRRRRRRKAVSIDLGPVLGAGMLAGSDPSAEATLATLRASGFYAIRHEDFLRLVSYALSSIDIVPAQIVVGVGTGGLMRQNQPADPYWSRTALYQHMNLVDVPPSSLLLLSSSSSPHSSDANPNGKGKTTNLSLCVDVPSAAEVVRTSLVKMLAKAMTMLPEELDANRAPSAYGVDSLVAVGVRSFILAAFAVEVSVFDVLGEDTISDLARGVAERAFAR